MRKVAFAAALVVFGLFAVEKCSARKHASDDSSDTAVSTSSKTPPADAKLIAVFDSGLTLNALGGQFGAWAKDPSDPTQQCTMAFIKPGYDGTGKCIKITYSVDSPNPAYNGFWMKLADYNASAYKKLVFWAKGEPAGTPPNNFKVELKNAKEVGHFYVSGITDDWTKIEIPLDKFEGLTDYQKLTEFTVVFEDSNTAPKKGSLSIDEMYFAK